MSSKDEQRQLVRQWEEADRILDAMGREALHDKPYDWREIDALLRLAEYYDGPQRTTNGLVEMERQFMKLMPRGE